MKSSRTSSVEELQVVSRFETLRKILLSPQYADHLDKPLAYWALPTDRRLPLALLGRTLDDLLHTPFAELSATPGIGQKKIRSLVKLLSRAANTDASQLPIDPDPLPDERRRPSTAASPSNGFDPSTVSEVVWAQWRSTVVKRSLGGEALGRFAPSLRRMSRVLWNTPLEAYADSTLDDIREMKTHGKKRVRAILETFHSIYELLAKMGHQDHLVVRIAPRRIDAVESWIGRALQTPGLPGPDEIRQHFIRPLLEQIRVDATRQIVNLAEHRLGIDGPVTSVRQAARTMGLTRARVYQLLNEVNDIISVRWPMGRHQVYELQDKFHERADEACDLEQFDAAVELFYPRSRRGAAGPVERAAEPVQPRRPRPAELVAQA